MTLDYAALRPLLQSGDFRRLFNRLGWDNFGGSIDITVSSETYSLEAVAQKRGVQVFRCPPASDGAIPGRGLRARIDALLRKYAHEHLVIYTDAESPPRQQVWQWVQVEPGRPRAIREQVFHAGHYGDAVLQKLEKIRFELTEELELTLVDVLERTKEAFGRRDKVTKKFFERFQQEHRAFLGFIQGIAAQGDRDWYASVMLNRLMFVYFMQKKRFLDGDIDYLGNRLRRVQAERGRGQFHSFYRAFLRKLFHGGLGTPEERRESGVEALIGKVPYLNGGIFEPHRLERENQDIDIPDEAFERVFAFFDSYDWHLDDRPLRNDREINPDVLGYIFEKYINQKQMGAYYTKEDITEYITRNTVLPFLLERTRENCKVAFQPGGPVWSLLANDPDRYIYPAVRHGVVDADGNVIPLPEDIDLGVADVSQRGGWNRSAPEPYNLPTETWREHVARRQRCLDLREKLRNGDVTEVNDLITHNLNIRQFAQDVIEQSEGPDVVKAFYDALEAVSVLDPTCGSGAFLFAALQILEPLYEACLDRMEAWLADEERLDRKHPGHRFETILDAVEGHANREYFIYKSIIINNLYGVDLMEEAVEICKLRLFLKLVSTVETADDVEPLPDVDFNIRAGNTLVGFTSLDAVRQAMSVDERGNHRMLFPADEQELRDIEESAAFADRAYRLFRDSQVNPDGKVDPAAKQALRDRLDDLDERLNHHLARQYRVDPGDPQAYATWRASHQPLHWFVEFHEVMARSGFDAIVGNPPWREYAEVRREYQVLGFRTEPSGNLHAICTERALGLRNANGSVSFIVQLPVVSSTRMKILRNELRNHSGALFIATFDDRPGRLFDGLEHCRATVFTSRGGVVSGPAPVFATKYNRWYSEARATLFETLELGCLDDALPYPDTFPKVASLAHRAALRRLASSADTTLGQERARSKTDSFVFYQESAQYWLKAALGVPYYAKDGSEGAPAHGRYVYFASKDQAAAAFALLNSSIFLNYFVSFGDCFHVNDHLLEGFPIQNGTLDDQALQELGRRISDSLVANATIKAIRTKDGATIEYHEYVGSRSKPEFDEVDRQFGRSIGLSAEELDFIINYDIKYRMGAADGPDGGE